jgi:hypothetical protein
MSVCPVCRYRYSGNYLYVPGMVVYVILLDRNDVESKKPLLQDYDVALFKAQLLNIYIYCLICLTYSLMYNLN